VVKVKNVSEGSSPGSPAAAPAEITFITDSRGRRFGLKKPTPGDRFELDDCIATKTEAAATQVTVVGCVVSIDEDGLAPLWTYDNAREEFKKRLTEIGDEGLLAIAPAVLKLFGLDPTAVARAKN
jgi:hypothetical protein